MNTLKYPEKPKAKYVVDDKVEMSSPTLYGEREGVITEVRRMYKRLDKYALAQGSEIFDKKGLVTFEDTIKSICIPYTFDGTYLVVDYGNEDQYIKGKEMSKFWGWCYTVKTPKMLTVYSERQLKFKPGWTSKLKPTKTNQ